MNPSSSVLAVANDGMMDWSSLALAVADEVDNEFIIITCAGCDDVMIIMLSIDCSPSALVAADEVDDESIVISAGRS